MRNSKVKEINYYVIDDIKTKEEQEKIISSLSKLHNGEIIKILGVQRTIKEDGTVINTDSIFSCIKQSIENILLKREDNNFHFNIILSFNKDIYMYNNKDSFFYLIERLNNISDEIADLNKENTTFYIGFFNQLYNTLYDFFNSKEEYKYICWLEYQDFIKYSTLYGTYSKLPKGKYELNIKTETEEIVRVYNILNLYYFIENELITDTKSQEKLRYYTPDYHARKIYKFLGIEYLEDKQEKATVIFEKLTSYNLIDRLFLISSANKSNTIYNQELVAYYKNLENIGLLHSTTDGRTIRDFLFDIYQNFIYEYCIIEALIYILGRKGYKLKRSNFYKIGLDAGFTFCPESLNPGRYNYPDIIVELGEHFLLVEAVNSCYNNYNNLNYFSKVLLNKEGTENDKRYYKGICDCLSDSSLQNIYFKKLFLRQNKLYNLLRTKGGIESATGKVTIKNSITEKEINISSIIDDVYLLHYDFFHYRPWVESSYRSYFNTGYEQLRTYRVAFINCKSLINSYCYKEESLIFGKPGYKVYIPFVTSDTAITNSQELQRVNNNIIATIKNTDTKNAIKEELQEKVNFSASKKATSTYSRKWSDICTNVYYGNLDYIKHLNILY